MWAGVLRPTRRRGTGWHAPVVRFTQQPRHESNRSERSRPFPRNDTRLDGRPGITVFNGLMSSRRSDVKNDSIAKKEMYGGHSATNSIRWPSSFFPSSRAPLSRISRTSAAARYFRRLNHLLCAVTVVTDVETYRERKNSAPRTLKRICSLLFSRVPSSKRVFTTLLHWRIRNMNAGIKSISCAK